MKKGRKVTVSDGLLYLVLERMDTLEKKLESIEKQVTNHLPTAMDAQVRTIKMVRWISILSLTLVGAVAVNSYGPQVVPLISTIINAILKLII